jgi:hypothetical protein
LIDARLYLPRDWVDDHERRRATCIPESVVYRSREELGLEMLHLARRRRALAGEWVAGNGRYARSSLLRRGLDAEGVRYLLEIPRSAPALASPTRTEHAQSRSSHTEPGAPDEHLERGLQMVDSCSDVARSGYRFAVRRIRDFPEGSLGTNHGLIVRRDADGRDLRQYLSNAADAPLETMAAISTRLDRSEAVLRFMSDHYLDGYEVRSWTGWYHHMALALFAGALLMPPTPRQISEAEPVIPEPFTR